MLKQRQTKMELPFHLSRLTLNPHIQSFPLPARLSLSSSDYLETLCSSHAQSISGWMDATRGEEPGAHSGTLMLNNVTVPQ